MPIHRETAGVRRGVSFATEVQVIGTSEMDPSMFFDQAAIIIPADMLFEQSNETVAIDVELQAEIEETDEAVGPVDASSSHNPEATDIRSSVVTSTHVPPPRSSSLGWRRQRTVCEVSATRLQIQSPPPPYDDGETAAIDDEELTSHCDPAPGYHDDQRPPTYAQAWRERDAELNDFLLEDMFHGMVGWFQGVGTEVIDAWNALTYNSPRHTEL